MKKFIGLFLCFSIILSLFVGIEVSAYSVDKLIDSSFTDEPLGKALTKFGWNTSSTVEAKIAKDPVSDKNCAMFTALAANARINKTIAPTVAKTVSVSFEVLFPQDGKFNIQLYAKNKNKLETQVVDLLENNGSFYLNNVDTRGGYSYRNSWTQFEIVVDFDNKVCALYSNGEKVWETISLKGDGSYRYLSRLDVTMATQGFVMYMRNLKVSAIAADLKSRDPYLDIDDVVSHDGVVYVDELGAKPDDGLDDSDAIAKAMKYTEYNPGTTVMFSGSVK